MAGRAPGDDEVLLPEKLRRVMRRWTTGVAVVTSSFDNQAHGMTVNSFTSVSLDPPVVSITLSNDTRTLRMIQKSGKFAVSILNGNQAELADRFAGKIGDDQDRFEGVEIFKLEDETPLIAHSCAFLNCNLIFNHRLTHSTLLLGEVSAAAVGDSCDPLVYLNRSYQVIHLPG